MFKINFNALSVSREAMWISLAVIAYIGIIFKTSLQVSFLISLALFSIFVMNIRFILTIPFLIMLIPITRFPGITEYVEIAKYVVFSLVLFLWFIKRGAKNLGYFKNNPLNIYFAVFLGLILLNLIFTIDINLSLKTGFVHALIFGYFYFFLDVFQDKEHLRKMLFLFILIGVFVACLAIVQYLAMQFKIFISAARFILPPVHRQGLLLGAKEIFQPGGYRSVGTFYHANLLGIYLAMSLPLDLCFIAMVKKKLYQFMLSIFALIIFIGIFCSGSRGAFINIIISSSFLLIVFRSKIPKKIILTGVLGLILLVVAAVIHLEKIVPYLRLEEILSYREIIWMNSLEMLKKQPISGLGMGTFHKYYIGSYGFSSLPDLKSVLNEITFTGSLDVLMRFHAHNLFLNYAVEMGVLGGVLVIIFYFIYLRVVISVCKINKSINVFDAVLIMGCTAVILGNFAHSFFETSVNFYNFSMGISFIFAVSIGVRLVLDNRSKIE